MSSVFLELVVAGRLPFGVADTRAWRLESVRQGPWSLISLNISTRSFLTHQTTSTERYSRCLGSLTLPIPRADASARRPLREGRCVKAAARCPTCPLTAPRCGAGEWTGKARVGCVCCSRRRGVGMRGEARSSSNQRKQQQPAAEQGEKEEEQGPGCVVWTRRPEQAVQGARA